MVGDIISERWAELSRNGGRLHSGIGGDIDRNPHEDPTAFAWNLEGREVAVTYWGGDNIGNNAWQEADAVLLFDADYKPRRVVLADTQGLLKAHPTDPGTPLAEMTSVRRKHAVVDGYAVGGLLRAHKQLALRGRARRFDEHGGCGVQKLVCGLSDQKWLLENFSLMFPGAPAPLIEQEHQDHGRRSYAERLLGLLTSPDTPNTVSTAWVGERLGRPWRDISRKLMTPAFKQTLTAVGWSYGGRGKAGATFSRVSDLPSASVPEVLSQCDRKSIRPSLELGTHSSG
jgi:hypothetical protein